MRRKYERLYRVAATYGINGADLDRNAPYVVRWMLEDRETDTSSGLASVDDLAAIEEARARARAEGVTGGGS